MTVFDQSQWWVHLSKQMLSKLSKSYNFRSVAKEFSRKLKKQKAANIQTLAKNVYGEYAEILMRAVMEFGDKYPDKASKMMAMVIEKTGNVFPHLPQRYLEISFLAIRSKDRWDLLENSLKKLTYTVTQCDQYKALEKLCGKETAAKLPCKWFCLNASKTMYKDINLPVTVKMTTSIPKDGSCTFTANLRKK